jgi:hypothetical protein
MSEPDAPVEASEPRFEKLFGERAPFLAPRQTFHPDYPFHPFVRIRLYPTAVPWEVFAYEPFGGWNDAPWPDEQLRMLRHWHGLYGVELVSRGSDFFELFVPRPPRTRHQAAHLDAELSAFGEEIGIRVETCDEKYPIPIERAHYWYFWWD